MRGLRLALAALVLLPIGAAAQEGWSLKWSGMVSPHYYADSRCVVGGREDMMLFYPKPIVRDSNGVDVNNGWQANMLGIAARLGLTVHGPDMLGAHTGAYIEGDFTGATNATINNLRLRHAYATLRWGSRHDLLVGQYWYAMVVHEIMPMTNPLNMGAPFHPYARYNQVRYTYKPSPHWEAVAVSQWQLDNASQGLLEGLPATSTLYARHSLVPELNAQLRYITPRLLLGVAANLKTIQPMVPDPKGTLHSSFTWSLFGKYVGKAITVKAQTLLNNSLYEGCSLGGYLILADTSFADWHFNTVWLDAEYNSGHWRPGLFLGFARNHDFLNSTYAYCLGRGHDLEYLWRIQPRLTYTTLQGLSFTAEAEYTRAGYAEPVGNLRLSFCTTYAF